MGARKKSLVTESEVDLAVDDLMVSMGLAPGSAPPDDEVGFDQGSARARPSAPRNATEQAAPSGAVDALWGSPAPRRK